MNIGDQLDTGPLFPAPDHLRIGLRFRRSDVARLRQIVEHYANVNGVDVSLFDKAREATEHGEPLIVLCDTPEEALQMAFGFMPWGIERPVIEDLNG
jgi:hypothetical protein